MKSEQKIAQPLVLVGLILLIFLAFETFIGVSLNIERVMPVDSTYIIALIDVFLISIGVVIGSPGKLKRYKGKVEIDLLKIGIMIALLLLAGFMIMSSMATVRWNDVWWFEPKLNFVLIRDNLKNGLFVSQLLILVLVLMFTLLGYEHKADREKKMQGSRV